jgi:alpha-amylase/alpha-mannosidase (GH57 family)
LTINFSPVLLAQIEDYVERGATDEAWELSRIPAERLDGRQQQAILTGFFDADWHNQIFIHPRYRSLFEQRRDGRGFSVQDLRDLQVWFNLSWFGKELRDGEVTLPDGSIAGVAALVRKESRFSQDDVEMLLAEQRKVMKAIVPLHAWLAAAGQLELSMTPFFHPILPLILDTDQASIDRPGASRPPRFAHPEDADAHVAQAVAGFKHWFGEAPKGAWPAEGAVSRSAVPIFARHGIRWIASDQGVLARSGRWGYEAHRSEVRHRIYRAEVDGAELSVLFRDTELSDDIGFRCQTLPPVEAASGWVAKLRERAGPGAAVTVVLDGENAWSAYRDDGRPFLHALYAALSDDDSIRTTTPTQLMEGGPDRVPAHPPPAQPRVYELHTGSWIDELGSAPGADLGTWIGESEENRGWTLLGQARAELEPQGLLDRLGSGGGPAYRALLAAEGSDWFWWFGADQDSGHDPDFDELFRLHLATAYRACGRPVPPSLAIPIVPRDAVWTFAEPIDHVFVGDALTVRANCPGVLAWSFSPRGEGGELALAPVGGVLAGLHRHQVRLGPFTHPGELTFRFRCRHPGCTCQESDACCRPQPALVTVLARS